LSLRQGTLPADRVKGVEIGARPHAAIREDASMNLQAIAVCHKCHELLRSVREWRLVLSDLAYRISWSARLVVFGG
jgi:hypothetical protein